MTSACLKHRAGINRNQIQSTRLIRRVKTYRSAPLAIPFRPFALLPPAMDQQQQQQLRQPSISQSQLTPKSTDSHLESPAHSRTLPPLTSSSSSSCSYLNPANQLTRAEVNIARQLVAPIDILQPNGPPQLLPGQEKGYCLYSRLAEARKTRIMDKRHPSSFQQLEKVCRSLILSSKSVPSPHTDLKPPNQLGEGTYATVRFTRSSSNYPLSDCPAHTWPRYSKAAIDKPAN